MRKLGFTHPNSYVGDISLWPSWEGHGKCPPTFVSLFICWNMECCGSLVLRGLSICFYRHLGWHGAQWKAFWTKLGGRGGPVPTDPRRLHEALPAHAAGLRPTADGCGDFLSGPTPGRPKILCFFWFLFFCWSLKLARIAGCEVFFLFPINRD